MTTTKKSKKIKRQIPFLVFNAYNEEHFRELESEVQVRDKVYTSTLESIKYAVAEGNKYAELFKLQDYYSIVILKRSDWPDVLNNAMLFWAGQEEFDRAIECQQLLQVL
jgi:hypothetical protein